MLRCRYFYDQAFCKYRKLGPNLSTKNKIFSVQEDTGLVPEVLLPAWTWPEESSVHLFFRLQSLPVTLELLFEIILCRRALSSPSLSRTCLIRPTKRYLKCPSFTSGFFKIRSDALDIVLRIIGENIRGVAIGICETLQPCTLFLRCFPLANNIVSLSSQHTNSAL